MQRIGLELESLLGQVSSLQDIIKNLCSTHTKLGKLEDADIILSYAVQTRHIRSLLDESVGPLLEYRNTVLNKGLSKVSDETLSLIFITVCSPSRRASGIDCSVAISQVCRRFRRVALETVQLWSCLYSTEPYTKSAALLSRTKSADLTIVVDDVYPLNESYLKGFFALLKPHCERWVEFRYCQCPQLFMGPFSSLNLNVLRKVTNKLYLPRLSRLHIYAGPNGATDLQPKQDLAICGDWVMPELRELIHYNGHPGLLSFKNLSSLVVALTRHDPRVGEMPCLSTLLESLADLPLLQILELVTASPTTVKKPIALTELSSLTTLHIHVVKTGLSGPLRIFYSALRLPSLSKLVLAMDPLDGAYFQTLFDCIAFKPNQCPSLKDVHIERTGVSSRSAVRSAFILDSIFQSFPSVHHLSVNLGDLKASYVGTETPAHLITFSLICYEIRESHLEGLIEGLKSAPGYTNFKKLRISQDRKYRQDSILASISPRTRDSLGENLSIEMEPPKRPYWTKDILSSFWDPVVQKSR